MSEVKLADVTKNTLDNFFFFSTRQYFSKNNNNDGNNKLAGEMGNLKIKMTSKFHLCEKFLKLFQSLEFLERCSSH